MGTQRKGKIRYHKQSIWKTPWMINQETIDDTGRRDYGNYEDPE